jgi:conjugal transfer pilus assembly protein TraV
MRNLLLALSIPVLTCGCTSTMSGLDGETKFSCKAPDGVTCSSLSGVYANAVANNLPALRKEGKGEAAGSAVAKAGEIVGRASSSGDPIRSQSKVLRIWIAPWEDSDGDLHDQSYVYVVADPGRWVIEHNQKRIIDRYRPTFIQAGTVGKTPSQTQPPQQPAGGGVVLPGAQGYGPTTPQQPNTGTGGQE